MGKRRTREQIQRLLREADRDLAKGLTVGDVCRKIGVSPTSSHRWRQRFDPAVVDEGRRIRELQVEVERLKLLVAELLLDKRMLQDVAKKSGDAQAAAGRGWLPRGELWRLTTARRPDAGARAFDASLSFPRPQRGAALERRHPPPGPPPSASRLSVRACLAGTRGLVGEPQTCPSAVEGTRAAPARAPQKT